jgi:hypothetical protein
MENQYFTQGPNMAYIVRPDGTATLYADYIGLEKQEISHYSTNILGTWKDLQPCDLAIFTEIKWRVIGKMQKGGAI